MIHALSTTRRTFEVGRKVSTVDIATTINEIKPTEFGYTVITDDFDIDVPSAAVIEVVRSRQTELTARIDRLKSISLSPRGWLVLARIADSDYISESIPVGIETWATDVLESAYDLPAVEELKANGLATFYFHTQTPWTERGEHCESTATITQDGWDLLQLFRSRAI